MALRRETSMAASTLSFTLIFPEITSTLWAMSSGIGQYVSSTTAEK
jgi:hypothetical protein